MNVFTNSIAAYANVRTRTEKRKNLSPKAGRLPHMEAAEAKSAPSILNGCKKNHLYEFSDENESWNLFDAA